jgi:acyl-ACP thioesterase
VCWARLQHAAPPPTADRAAWPLRFTDFDVLGHVNNAAYWEPVEEVLAERRDLRAPLRAELEHQQAAELGATPTLVRHDGDDGSVGLWLVTEGGNPQVHASAVLRMRS